MDSLTKPFTSNRPLREWWTKEMPADWPGVGDEALVLRGPLAGMTVEVKERDSEGVMVVVIVGGPAAGHRYKALPEPDLLEVTRTTWRSTWRPDPSLSPLEGRRGAGERAGDYGLATFTAGTYPACSTHGAMNCVQRQRDDGTSLWRCLFEGCNIGAVWSR